MFKNRNPDPELVPEQVPERSRRVVEGKPKGHLKEDSINVKKLVLAAFPKLASASPCDTKLPDT